MHEGQKKALGPALTGTKSKQKAVQGLGKATEAGEGLRVKRAECAQRTPRTPVCAQPYSQSEGRLPPPARAGGAAALPCLNSNNSTEEELRKRANALKPSHKKTAFALVENVQRMARKHGLERLGFFTLTFADHVTDQKEASRRFDSLNTHVLKGRFVEWIAVPERQKSGRVHFHLLVALREDIRTGFNFEEASRGVYGSANAFLRSEWAFWRHRAKDFGFGRCEMLPIRSTSDGIARYVGKYIAKAGATREARDKGTRLVRYSQGASGCSTAFAWHSQRGMLWRHQVQLFAQANRCFSLDDLSERFGKRWAYVQRPRILAMKPTKHYLHELWEVDRWEVVEKAAHALGCTNEEAFIALYQRDTFGRKGELTWTRSGGAGGESPPVEAGIAFRPGQSGVR